MTRNAGIAAITGAALAIAGNAALFAVRPVVPSDKLSWPLSPHDYVFMQLFFALTQLLMAIGIFGLTPLRCCPARPCGPGARRLAAAGMSLTVPASWC